MIYMGEKCFIVVTQQTKQVREGVSVQKLSHFFSAAISSRGFLKLNYIKIGFRGFLFIDLIREGRQLVGMHLCRGLPLANWGMHLHWQVTISLNECSP